MFSNPVARRKLGRNSIGNVRAWTEFLVAMLEKPAAVVAALAQVLHKPPPSKAASAGCCEHLVTLFFDKSCCF